MANTPGVPQPRKNATSGFNPKNASATANDTAGKSAYRRRSATAFGNPKKNEIQGRRSAGISPAAQPVGDHDAGNNEYRKNTASPSANPPYPRNGQPFNNKSGQNMSKVKKGAD
jgi:hypothetical protein